MSKSFGSKDLQKCLLKLNFYQKTSNSSHVKYLHKDGKKGRYPFLMVQLGKKDYGQGFISTNNLNVEDVLNHVKSRLFNR